MICKKSFNQLNTHELLKLLRARISVFVVEQNCPYPEIDDNDLIAQHLYAQSDEQIAAYCRIYLTDDGVHIGRVLVVQAYRGQGLAKKLMQRALTYAQTTFADQPIQIQAQAYLQKCYENLGFIATSDIYLEDNIPHINMRFQAA